MPEVTQEAIDALTERATAGDTATAELAETNERLAAVQAGSATAHAALIESTRAANPTIPPELIAGDNAQQIAASVQQGADIVAKVKEADKPAETKKPPAANAGAPPRDANTGRAPDDVTGLARIQHALDTRSDS